MNTTKPSTLLAACLIAAPSASAFSIHPELFYQPGNNAYFTAVPDPARPGYLMDGIVLLRTEDQMAQAITTYSGFPAGSFNPAAGITILVPEWRSGLAERLNTQGLTVGPDAIAVLREMNLGVFTEVFGIYAPDVFGFGSINFLDGFGIVGSPIVFAYDRAHSLNANRFLTADAITAGYRNAYVSTPLVRLVPDGGTTAGMLAMAFAFLVWVRRMLGRGES